MKRSIGPMVKVKDQLPQEVILEFLGNVSFSSNPEGDVSIAEQIASNNYSSLQNLIDTCRGEIRVGRLKKEFEAMVKRLPESPFYQKYLKDEPDLSMKAFMAEMSKLGRSVSNPAQYGEWKRKQSNR